MSHRAYLGVVALSVCSCARALPTRPIADAKPSAVATASSSHSSPQPPTTLQEPPQETALFLEDDARHLEVTPLDAGKQREALAVHSSDDKYALEGEQGSFGVRATSSGRVIVNRQGWFARWVSETEVAFLDSAGRLTKVDVAAPSKPVSGGRICGNVLPCDPNRPPPASSMGERGSRARGGSWTIGRTVPPSTERGRETGNRAWRRARLEDHGSRREQARMALRSDGT